MPFAGLIVFDYETGLKTKLTYSKVGMTTHHSNLVQPLRKHAKAEPTVKLIEGIVTELVKENGHVTGVKYREKDSQDLKLIRAPLTVISDGTYSKFRKVSPNVTDSETESHVIGIEIRNAEHPDPSYPEVGVGSPLVQTVTYRLDDTTSRVLIMFRDKPPENIAQFLEIQVAPNLPDFLQIPVLEALKRQSYYKCVQAKRTPASNDNLPGVLVLGDALNARDPIAASGMSATLNDVKFWQRALSGIPDLSDDEAFLKQKELFMKQRKSYSWTVNMAAHTLITLGSERQSSSIKLRYALMRNTKALEDVPREVQQAAYDLFSLLNVDEGLLRMLLFNTCRDAVLQCITWRSLIEPWKTVQDIYGIINKYRSIISADV
ncbi:squalene monooxygenase-like [Amphiura filiformis]|uniref:squalene monooxygenase-like n=1 Tax=Amphiura filiformis TaxID=82378 RepID=UPI003B210652